MLPVTSNSAFGIITNWNNKQFKIIQLLHFCRHFNSQPISWQCRRAVRRWKEFKNFLPVHRRGLQVLRGTHQRDRSFSSRLFWRWSSVIDKESSWCHEKGKNQMASSHGQVRGRLLWSWWARSAWGRTRTVYRDGRRRGILCHRLSRSRADERKWNGPFFF